MTEDVVTQQDLDSAREAAHRYAEEDMDADELTREAVNHGIEILYRKLTRDDYRPDPDDE